MINATELLHQVVLLQYEDFVGNDRRDYDIACRKVFFRHVHKIFQHSERDGLGHVYDRSSGRIPTAPNALGTLAVQACVNGAAHSVDPPGHLRRDIVLDAGEDLVDTVDIASTRQNLNRAAVAEQR